MFANSKELLRRSIFVRLTLNVNGKGANFVLTIRRAVWYYTPHSAHDKGRHVERSVHNRKVRKIVSNPSPDEATAEDVENMVSAWH